MTLYSKLIQHYNNDIPEYFYLIYVIFPLVYFLIILLFIN